MKSLVAKINLTGILKAHFNTLVDASSSANRYQFGDFAVSIGLPLIISLLFAWYVIPTTKEIIGVLITSLSVFAGLLFNLLVLVMQIIERKKGNSEFIRLQKETYANIAYAILVALITSAILLTPYFVDVNVSAASEVEKVSIPLWIRFFWATIYFLLINFALTMAMVLKRMHAILVRIMDY